MATPSTPPTAWGALGPDPGQAIRCWVVLLLRLGIGLSLLGTGLAGYFESQRTGAGMVGWGQNPSMMGYSLLFSVLPYIEMGLGLALILGFLTKTAAIASGFFSLLMPLMSIIQIVGTGPSNPGGWQFYTPNAGVPSNFAVLMTTFLPNLLTQAALIWLSPLRNHPYSIDTLIFSRNEIESPEPVLAPTPAPATEHPAEPEA